MQRWETPTIPHSGFCLTVGSGRLIQREAGPHHLCKTSTKFGLPYNAVISPSWIKRVALKVRQNQKSGDGALSQIAIEAQRAHRARQEEERAQLGAAWEDIDL